VGQIAIPRTLMDAVAVGTPVEQALRFAVQSRHTRLPVYEGDMDLILGFVHVKDLFSHYKNTRGRDDIRKIVRKAAFVPETAPLKQVWETLRREESYLAIVLDEFGGAAGMVTWEDLLEELFGELRDEFDEGEEPLISPLGRHEYLVRGETPIGYLNTRFGLSLSARRVYSVAGLLISRLNRLPQVGDVVEIDGLQLRVQRMRGKAVETIRLQLPGTAPGAGRAGEEAG
jgi:CBS domain containing-hemolysin-like protein